MDTERIDQIVDKHQGEESSLIQVLLEIQRENNWLPRAALWRVSEKLGVPFTWRQGPGSHEWSYWDAEIQNVLKWLPLRGAR